MEVAARVSLLQQALQGNSISPHYDEPFLEVAKRIAEAGSAGKSDIAVLSFWKRVRADTGWVTKLLGMPEREVRAITSRAVDAVRAATDVADAAREGREELRALPGFRSQPPMMPSALLCAIDPARLAVYDVRAERGLQIVEKPVPEGRRGVHDFYARYMIAVEELRDEARSSGHQWSARDVDIALFLLGKQRHR